MENLVMIECPFCQSEMIEDNEIVSIFPDKFPSGHAVKCSGDCWISGIAIDADALVGSKALSPDETKLIEALNGLLRHFRWNSVMGAGSKFDIIKRTTIGDSIFAANNVLAEMQNKVLKNSEVGM